MRAYKTTPLPATSVTLNIEAFVGCLTTFLRPHLCSSEKLSLKVDLKLQTIPSCDTSIDGVVFRLLGALGSGLPSATS